jgi:hypothetical protein
VKHDGVNVFHSYLDVARASDGHLEGVDVQTFLVGVGQQPDEVVLLQALAVNLMVDVGAGSARVPVKHHNHFKSAPFFQAKVVYNVSFTCTVPISGSGCTSRSPCRSPWRSIRRAGSR